MGGGDKQSKDLQGGESTEEEAEDFVVVVVAAAAVGYTVVVVVVLGGDEMDICTCHQCLIITIVVTLRLLHLHSFVVFRRLLVVVTPVEFL